jgi:hypothetical protein
MTGKQGVTERTRGPGYLALALSFAILSGASAAEAQIVFRFSGSAGRVGDALPPAGQPGGAPVNIHGRFFYPDDIDLCAASLTLTDVLANDLGELVRGIDGAPVLPVVLEEPQCSSSGDAVFRSPDDVRPSFRVAVRERTDDIFDFHVKITRATIPTRPTACTGGAASSALGTSFVLDDGVNPETVVATIESWRCKGPTLRAARVSPAPTPTPVPGVTPTPTPVPPPTAVPTPSPIPTPEQGVEIDFTGKATRVEEIGTPIDAAEIRISGTFCGAVIPDLMAVSITFDSVLFEEDGAGELLAGAPLVLAAVEPTADGIAYECQVAGPSCWMEVKQTIACDLPGPNTGVRYEYSLKIDRSQDERRVPITYASAPSCASGDNTELTTDFTLSDGIPLRMRTERVWRCNGDEEAVSELRAD